jgi:hypothetical protein
MRNTRSLPTRPPIVPSDGIRGARPDATRLESRAARAPGARGAGADRSGVLIPFTDCDSSPGDNLSLVARNLGGIGYACIRERWLTGLRQAHFGALYGQPYRGFESFPSPPSVELGPTPVSAPPSAAFTGGAAGRFRDPALEPPDQLGSLILVEQAADGVSRQGRTLGRATRLARPTVAHQHAQPLPFGPPE